MTAKFHSPASGLDSIAYTVHLRPANGEGITLKEWANSSSNNQKTRHMYHEGQPNQCYSGLLTNWGESRLRLFIDHRVPDL